METIAELVRARAGDTNVGLRFEESSWTWAEVVEAAAQRAAFFRAHAPPDAPFHVGCPARQHPRVLVHALRGRARRRDRRRHQPDAARRRARARHRPHRLRVRAHRDRASRAVRSRRRARWSPARLYVVDEPGVGRVRSRRSRVRRCPETGPSPDRHVHADLHVGHHRRAEGGADGPRAARGLRRQARRDVRSDPARRLLLGHAALPLERRGRRLRERARRRVRPACCAAASRRRTSCPTSAATASRSSTTSASRSATSSRPRSAPTTPTTRCGSRSATRRRRSTSTASRSASVASSPTATARPRAA